MSKMIRHLKILTIRRISSPRAFDIAFGASLTLVSTLLVTCTQLSFQEKALRINVSMDSRKFLISNLSKIETEIKVCQNYMYQEGFNVAKQMELDGPEKVNAELLKKYEDKRQDCLQRVSEMNFILPIYKLHSSEVNGCFDKFKSLFNVIDQARSRAAIGGKNVEIDISKSIILHHLESEVACRKGFSDLAQIISKNYGEP